MNAMTVAELKKLIKNLDPNMEVVMGVDDVTFISACKQFSEVIEADNDGEVELLFIIVPCTCHEEVEELHINEDELNLN